MLIDCLAVRLGLADPDPSATGDKLAESERAALDHLLRRLEARRPDRLPSQEEVRRLAGRDTAPVETATFHPPAARPDPPDRAATSEVDRAVPTTLIRPTATAPHDDDRTRISLGQAVEPERRWDEAAGAPKGSGPLFTKLQLHASGGMGRVWVVRDLALGREVALKELRPERSDAPATRARFVREACITGRLQHPNIVPVYGYVHPTTGGSPAYTMRLIAGRTLADAGKEFHRRREAGWAGAVEFRELLAAFVAVCNAVAYAHSQRVIHRDLKGANVVLGDYGEVVVLDWGLAKRLGEADDLTGPGDLPGDASETAAGTVMGTPQFMAPEQAEGLTDRLDERTDVYGLGATLYELLCGRPPFTGRDTAEVLERVRREAPADPRSWAAGVPRPLEAVCHKALRKRPDDRYPSAAAMAADVRRYLADEPVSAYREPVAERVGRKLRKNRTLATAVAVAVAVLIPGLALYAELERRGARRLADEQAQTADAKGLAEQRLGQVVDTWYDQIITVQNELDGQAVSPRFRASVLGQARDRLADVLRGRPPGRNTDHMLHVVYRRLAEARLESGDAAAADAACREAERIARERFTSDPEGPDSRRDLADALLTRADLRAGAGEWGAALDACAEAEGHLLAHLDARPDDRRGWDDRVKLASRRGRYLLLAGRKRESLDAADAAVRYARDYSTRWAGDPTGESLRLLALQTAAVTAQATGGTGEAYLVEAMTVIGEQLNADPTNRRLLGEQARLLSLHGEAERAAGRPAAARERYERALAIRLDLVARSPDTPPALLHELAVVYERLGDLSHAASRFRQAVVEYEEGLRVAERLTITHPVRPYRATQANLLARLGASRLALDDAAGARPTLARCLALRRELADATPDDPRATFDLAQAHQLLGNLARHATVLDFARAEAEYRAARDRLSNAKGRPALDDQRAEWAELLRNSEWGAVYCRRVLEVLADPARANGYPPGEAFPLLIARMRVRARAGDAAGAAAAGEAIRRLQPGDGGYLAGAARGYALAVQVAKTRAEKQKHAAVTADLLTLAARQGADLGPLAADHDFAGFREFLAPPIPPAAR